MYFKVRNALLSIAFVIYKNHLLNLIGSRVDRIINDLYVVIAEGCLESEASIQ